MREIRTRLEHGEREYGDSAFDRDGSELVKETQEELLDVCAWSYFLWRRLAMVSATMEGSTSCVVRSAGSGTASVKTSKRRSRPRNKLKR